MSKTIERDAIDSRRMALAELMSKTDELALHYIKMSAGFAAAYPTEAAEYAALYEQDEEQQEEREEVMKQWEFRFGEAVAVGAEVDYEDDTYEVLQAHTISAEWCPPDTPALYRKKQGGEWPEWVQPTGASDAYALGAKVSHNDKHWVSSVDANVWEPGVYGWTEQS